MMFSLFSRIGSATAAISILIFTYSTQAFAQIGTVIRSSSSSTDTCSSSPLTNGVVFGKKVNNKTSLLPLPFLGSFNTSNTGITPSTGTSSRQQMSTQQQQDEFPKSISVQPGTSPVESQPSLNPIDNTCTILIVGASRGIGIQFVKSTLHRGATVFATYRGDDVPNELQSWKEIYPKQLYFLQMDLGDETSIQNAAKELQSIFKQQQPQNNNNDNNNHKCNGLTHIIHNAGIYLSGTSFDGKSRGPRKSAPPVTKEIMMKTFEINTIAPLLIAQNFVPLLSKRSRSSSTRTLLPILSFVSSKVGSIDDNTSGGAYAYRSSKSALNNIAKSLSIDLAGECSVVLLHPGYVRTDMTDGNGLIDADESVEGMLRAVEATDGSVGFRFVDYKACLIPW